MLSHGSRPEPRGARPRRARGPRRRTMPAVPRTVRRRRRSMSWVRTTLQRSGGGDAQRAPQGGDVALHRGLLQVEARRCAPKALAASGSRPNRSRWARAARPSAPGGRRRSPRCRQGSTAPAAAGRAGSGRRRGARRGPGTAVALEERLAASSARDPDARSGAARGVDDVGRALGSQRRRRRGPRRGSPAPTGRAERRPGGSRRCGCAALSHDGRTPAKRARRRPRVAQIEHAVHDRRTHGAREGSGRSTSRRGSRERCPRRA